MKKYIILLICAVVGVGAALSLPLIVNAMTPEVKVIVAKPDNIETAVLCTGRVETVENVDVTVEVPIKPQKIMVEVGDTVSEGQTLLTVDTNMSLQASLQTNATSTTIPREVTAPVSGIVTAVNVNKNATAAASAALVTISGGEKLQVRLAISENDISDVKEGQSVVITGSGFEGVEYSGKISKIYSVAKQKTTLSSEVVVEAIAEISNPDDRIKPGFTAKVRIITDIGTGVLILPYDSVAKESGGRQYVYVVVGDFAHRKFVEINREGENGIEIVSGVQVGQLVVKDASAIGSEQRRVRPVMAQTEEEYD